MCHAVITGIWDIGWQHAYGNDARKQLCVDFQLDQRDSNGKRHMKSLRLNATLGEGSHLRNLVDCTLGENLSGPTRQALDTNRMIGHTVLVKVIAGTGRHNGKVFLDNKVNPPMSGHKGLSVEGNFETIKGFAKWARDQQLPEDEALRIRELRRAAEELEKGGQELKRKMRESQEQPKPQQQQGQGKPIDMPDATPDPDDNIPF